jgi:uncharacterized protein (TIGR03067 family)
MRNATLLFAALAVASAVAAPLPFPKGQDRAELRRLQGGWLAARMCYSGSETGSLDTQVSVAGDRITFSTGSAKVIWAFTLGPKKSLREMDMRCVGGTVPGSIGATIKAIYRLDGDSLTFSYIEGKSSEYPADFDDRRKCQWLAVFRRKR